MAEEITYVPCPCMGKGLTYSGANWGDDPDGSPDECPHCDHTGEIPDFIAAQLRETALYVREPRTNQTLETNDD